MIELLLAITVVLVVLAPAAILCVKFHQRLLGQECQNKAMTFANHRMEQLLAGDVALAGSHQEQIDEASIQYTVVSSLTPVETGSVLKTIVTYTDYQGQSQSIAFSRLVLNE